MFNYLLTDLHNQPHRHSRSDSGLIAIYDIESIICIACHYYIITLHAPHDANASESAAARRLSAIYKLHCRINMICHGPARAARVSPPGLPAACHLSGPPAPSLRCLSSLRGSAACRLSYGGQTGLRRKHNKIFHIPCIT